MRPAPANARRDSGRQGSIIATATLLASACARTSSVMLSPATAALAGQSAARVANRGAPGRPFHIMPVNLYRTLQRPYQPSTRPYHPLADAVNCRSIRAHYATVCRSSWKAAGRRRIPSSSTYRRSASRNWGSLHSIQNALASSDWRSCGVLIAYPALSRLPPCYSVEKPVARHSPKWKRIFRKIARPIR